MKVGEKLIAINECKMDGTESKTLTIGKEYSVIEIYNDEFEILDDKNDAHFFDYSTYKHFFRLKKDKPQKDEHYNNENGSLYLFAQQHELNAWEFDILKRIVRCRKKGQFKEDLEKTKRVIDLYLKEFEA